MSKKASVPKLKQTKKPEKSGFKTGEQGKVWGKEYNDWIPSLYLSPVR